LRPWLLMQALGIAFEDRLEPFARPDNYDDFRAFSPTGQVPLLIDGWLIGAVAVSGATSIQDHEIAQRAASLLGG